MRNRRLMATAAGGLLVGLVAVPMSGLYGQGTAPGTGTTPGQTSPTPNVPTDQAGVPPGQTGKVPTPVSTSGTVGINADGKIIRDVITDDLLETRLGQLALQKAVNPSVRQFAQRMISDHSRMESEWISMASQNGMSVNPQLDNTDKAKLDQLSRLSGTAFDQAYMNLMIQSHRDALNLLQTEGQSAQSAPVRARVATDLPIVQQHLMLAQQVGAQVGANTSVVTTTPTPTTTTTTGATPARSGVVDRNVKADIKFIREETADNKLETDLAQLAETRAQNSDVRRYAQRMITDHNRLQNEWLNMAASSGLSINPSYGKKHRRKLEDLQKVSGQDFDRAYMTLMIQNHKDYITAFRTDGRNAHSTQVRNLVSNDLPVLEQHLSMAQQIGTKVGADPNTVSPRSSY
jgi:putative membrane protein